MEGRDRRRPRRVFRSRHELPHAPYGRSGLQEVPREPQPLDYLTISYYCPARTKADKGKSLSVEEMADRLKGAHARMSAIAQATGKPIVFGECGCASIKDGAASPSGLDVEAEPDEDEQAMYMEALFRVFAHETWCRGFHWWKWDQHSPRRKGVTREQVRARDFTIRGKKAEAVFRRWATR